MGDHLETVILVIDLEATCSDNGAIPADDMEIIEIGACWAWADGTLLDEFQRFVRPIINPHLTPFCSTLTGIRQSQVDNAQSFAEVATQLREFVNSGHFTQDSFWMSWGKYDCAQLVRDSERHQTANPLTLPHKNAKRMFAKAQKIGKEVGLAKACDLTRLGMNGAHHRALDDARNVVRLLPWVLGRRTLQDKSL